MTPHDVIYGVLERSVGFNKADKLTTEILERLAAQAFVVVHADRVIQQAGKVSVSRTLVESVLEDAATWVQANYIVGVSEGVHPAMQKKYERDMEDIRALAAELREAPNA
ncbi:MAG: hypothetical protein RLZZ187_2611 [Pseudomonadota bacterium]|jgi:alkylated DNA nucleotide flippase Atl1